MAVKFFSQILAAEADFNDVLDFHEDLVVDIGFGVGRKVFQGSFVILDQGSED